MKIPFSPPYVDDDVKAEVLSALESGWITTGPKVKALEMETAKYVGASHVLCVNSATSGLMLAMHWLGIKGGDEVIVPAYTYCATALAVLHVGATPVMVDVARDFNIDVAKVRAAITPRTKAIIPVDFAGFPCDYDALHALVNDDDTRAQFSPNGDIQKQLGRIAILADAAHSFGAVYKGKKTGTLADLTVFSFHAVKNLTTAEGGAISIHMPAPFDNEAVYRTLRLWSLNGQTKDAFSKSQAGGWRYDVAYAGYKMNMPDVCAAIGLAQVRKYDDVLLKERQRVFDYFSRAFANDAWAELPMQDVSSVSSYHLYPLRVKGVAEAERDAIIGEITKAEIAVNVHFIPLPMLTAFKDRGYDIRNFPVAYDNYSREISLPIYPQLNNKLCEVIVKAVRSAVVQTFNAVSNVVKTEIQPAIGNDLNQLKRVEIEAEVA